MIIWKFVRKYRGESQSYSFFRVTKYYFPPRCSTSKDRASIIHLSRTILLWFLLFRVIFLSYLFVDTIWWMDEMWGQDGRTSRIKILAEIFLVTYNKSYINGANVFLNIRNFETCSKVLVKDFFVLNIEGMTIPQLLSYTFTMSFYKKKMCKKIKYYSFYQILYYLFLHITN